MTADRMTLGDLDGWVEDGAHHYLLRVRFEDTDAGGIIYHANYLAFAERARSAYLRCIDIRQEEKMAAGVEDSMMFVVRRLSIDYMRAAGLGAALKVETRLQSFRGASITLIQEVVNFKNGHILARLLVDIGYVVAGRDGGARPRRMPSAVVERLRAATPPDTAPG